MIPTGKKCNNVTQPAGAHSDLEILIARAQAGDRQAFDNLVDRFWPDIFRMVYYRVRSAMDAEDLAQDIFVVVFRRIKSLKDPSRFRPWLFTIALNRVRDFQRKKRFREVFGFFTGGDEDTVGYYAVSDEPGPLDNIMRQDFWERVGSFLSKLSRLEKEVFILRFMDQLSIGEIAEVMGKGQSTIKTHLYRALTKFRKESRLVGLLEGME